MLIVLGFFLGKPHGITTKLLYTIFAVVSFTAAFLWPRYAGYSVLAFSASLSASISSDAKSVFVWVFIFQGFLVIVVAAYLGFSIRKRLT